MSNHELHNLIPGGAHTYTKGDDQFPANAPSMIERGEGAYVYDTEGNRFLDLTMGLTSVILGHAYEPVLKAVREEMQKGVNFQRPAPVELEFARYLDELFPWFDQFKFAKNGSTVTTAAVKLARAYTGRDLVAVCEDHDFFSYDDWYIGTTVMDRGVPDNIKNLSISFPYGDLEETQRIFEQHEGDIAAIVLEPITHEQPPDNYLRDLKELCHAHGIVFILDEIITGCKWNLRGAQATYNVQPDLATFGKSIANGFSVDLLAGKREIMKLGGLNHDQERVFLISTTNGAETHGLRAALTTLKEMRENDVIEHRKRMGKRLKTELETLFEEKGLGPYLEIIGFPALPLLKARGPDGNESGACRTLLCQELIKEGILFQGLVTLSYSHGEEQIREALKGFDRATDVYKQAIQQEAVEEYLEGPPIKPVFRKYN